jgi:uncharacterized phage infection (PIP) family protein YhgE
MPGYSSECQPIADKIEGLQSQVASFQKELQTAAPGAKSALISQISKLQQQVAQQEGLLNDCVKKNPYQPPPGPPKNPCLSINHDLKQLQEQLEQVIQKALAPLQAELQKTPGPAKAGILEQIKNERARIMATNPLVKEIAAKQKDYNDCLLKHGGKLAIDADFKGKATMRTNNEHAKGPFIQNVTIGLRFSAWNNAHIDVTDFPGVSVTYDTHSPAGTVTTTVSMTSGSGTFDEKTRMITFHLELYFEHSTSLAGPSSLNIDLSGSKPMTSDGGIDVSGDSTFKGGYLGGNTCSIEVSGKISPHP